MISYVGILTKTEEDQEFEGAIELAPFNDFQEWVESKRELQLDTETNVVKSIVDRVLITVQFGDGKDRWVLQWSALTDKQKLYIKKVLEDRRRLKIAHNAMFERKIFLKYGIQLENVWDTMLVEIILHTGIKQPEGFYSLAGLISRYLFIQLDKSQQTGFGDNILTPRKIVYAGNDVTYLGYLKKAQTERLKLERLEAVAALENEAVLAYSEIEYNGMQLDQEAWLATVDKAKPIVQAAEDKLNQYLRGELKEAAIKLGYLTNQDEVILNWNAPKQRQDALKLIYPDLLGATKPIVTKYLKANPQAGLLQSYLDKNFEPLNEELSNNHREWLLTNEYFIPADTITINWSSTDQRLELFKVVEPQLKDTSKESLAKTKHPIIKDFQRYINSTKLITSFGQDFIDQYVDSDGKVRTQIQQIINTGRVSMRDPNMQNIPAKEEVGNIYRNCFIPPPGWKIADSDYNSQELVIIAYMSNDPVWMEALRKGQDLHSVCAELVFGSKWKEAAEETCTYYHKDKAKCSCKKHKSMRTKVKTINFG